LSIDLIRLGGGDWLVASCHLMKSSLMDLGNINYKVSYYF